MAKQLTRRQIRRLAEERYEREPIYDDPQPRRVSGWEKMMYVIVTIMCLAVLWSAVIAPLLAPLPQPYAPALPTAALSPIQGAPQAPPASSYQQPAVAPQVEPTTPAVAPTTIPVSAPPEPVAAPQAGAHPQAEPTAGSFGGRRNDREAPPQLMGKPRK